VTRKTLWRGVAISLLCCALACWLTGLRVTEDSADRVVLACMLLIVGLLADPARLGRAAWLVEAIEAIALLALIGMLGAVSSYVVLWHAGPLADPLLDQLDHSLGFDWVQVRKTVAMRPWAMELLERAYRACFWLPSAAILLLCASGRTARVHRLLSTFGLTILLGLPLFYLLPAAAAFDFYAYAPLPPNAEHYGRLIAALHAHRLHAIDLNDLGGIISFPSFHAIMALLFAWALWPIRYLRPLALPTNAAMWLAAIPIGGHYLVDVIGGSLVAIAALLLTRTSAARASARPQASAAGLAVQRG